MAAQLENAAALAGSGTDATDPLSWLITGLPAAAEGRSHTAGAVGTLTPDDPALGGDCNSAIASKNRNANLASHSLHGPHSPFPNCPNMPFTELFVFAPGSN